MARAPTEAWLAHEPYRHRCVIPASAPVPPPPPTPAPPDVPLPHTWRDAILPEYLRDIEAALDAQQRYH
eukprot:1138260-Pleurochrysis_carterae.AAC.1